MLHYLDHMANKKWRVRLRGCSEWFHRDTVDAEGFPIVKLDLVSLLSIFWRRPRMFRFLLVERKLASQPVYVLIQSPDEITNRD